MGGGRFSTPSKSQVSCRAGRWLWGRRWCFIEDGGGFNKSDVNGENEEEDRINEGGSQEDCEEAKVEDVKNTKKTRKTRG